MSSYTTASSGLYDLSVGRKVSWTRICQDLYDLGAEKDEISIVYAYLVNDDRVQMAGISPDGSIEWQARFAHDEIAADIQVLLAKRRLVKPKEEEKEEDDDV